MTVHPILNRFPCILIKGVSGHGNYRYSASIFLLGKPNRLSSLQAVLGEKKIENVSMDWKGKRLLVAEDNKLNMEIAVTLLEMEGFQLETVQNGKAALELYLKKEPYYFDAILMDIQMPIMDSLAKCPVFEF